MANEVDAKKIQYDSVWINEINGLFTKQRVDHYTVSDNYNVYEIRHKDGDSNKPCTIEPKVRVNFYGTFITTTDLSKDMKGDDPYIEINSFRYSGIIARLKKY